MTDKCTVSSKTVTEHELKVASEFFDAVESGQKPFEIRKGDRPFKVGDTLWLREVDIVLAYTGREARKRITFVLRGWGMESGYVALGLAPSPVETTAANQPDPYVQALSEAGIRAERDRRIIERHVRWRETAIGFLRQVIDGRGSEDEWPALAEFLERSDSRIVESSPEKRAACDGCGVPATARCPHCQAVTCGKCAVCEHSPVEPVGKLPPAFQSLLDLQPNWDSYGAKRINLACVQKVYEIWQQLAGTWLPVPHSDGTVGLEQHQGGFDIEIDVDFAAPEKASAPPVPACGNPVKASCAHPLDAMMTTDVPGVFACRICRDSTRYKECPACFGDRQISMSDGSKRTCERCAGAGRVEVSEPDGKA